MSIGGALLAQSTTLEQPRFEAVPLKPVGRLAVRIQSGQRTGHGSPERIPLHAGQVNLYLTPEFTDTGGRFGQILAGGWSRLADDRQIRSGSQDAFRYRPRRCAAHASDAVVRTVRSEIPPRAQRVARQRVARLKNRNQGGAGHSKAGVLQHQHRCRPLCLQWYSAPRFRRLFGPKRWDAGVFSAVEKLGLKLERRKTPVESILIGHVERTPGAN